MMKSLAVALLLLTSTAAFAIDHPVVQAQPAQPTLQDLAARAALRSAVEREQYENTIQQLSEQIKELRAAAEKASIESKAKAAKDGSAPDPKE